MLKSMGFIMQEVVVDFNLKVVRSSEFNLVVVLGWMGEVEGLSEDGNGEGLEQSKGGDIVGLGSLLEVGGKEEGEVSWND